MIKFHAGGPEGDLYGFGLSAGNIEFLKQGKPIVIDMGEVGVPNIHIALLYGETEKAIVEELQGLGILPASFDPLQLGPGEVRVFRDRSEEKLGGSGV